MASHPGNKPRWSVFALCVRQLLEPGWRGVLGWECNVFVCECSIHKLHIIVYPLLKVHKIEIFFGFDFEICNISLLVMSKY